MPEFVYPDFVQDNDADIIHERMMQNLPMDISAMPGDFAYDITYPAALEKSELVQYHIVRTLMLMFPQYAWGEWLDLHGEQAGLTRKPAGYAYGKLEITAQPGTRIEGQSIFCTAAADTGASIEFVSEEPVEIPESGVAVVEIVALESGTGSNVAAGTITLAMNPMEKVTKIWNPEAVTGGSEEESDEDYRDRILEYYQSGVSFVGNDADYIRWAKEVVGVGAASVIPEWNGPGTVKLILIDSNGRPANEHICDEVYTYIMHPEDRIQRKAPIGAILTVSAPDLVTVTYTATVEPEAGYTLEAIRAEFEKNLLKYYDEALADGEVKYTRAASVLSETDGVNDYTDFRMNGDVRNIGIHTNEFPITESVTFASGVVE